MTPNEPSEHEERPDQRPEAHPDEQGDAPNVDGQAEPVAAPAAADTGAVSPGRLLREAREAKGLDLDSVASQVKLSVVTLMAMESDDFVTLNEPVYVRGYYRRCAQVLGLPIESVVAAYERAARPAAPALPTKLPVVPGGEMPTGGGRLRFVLALLLVLGAVAAVVWWLGRPPVVVTEPRPGTTPQVTPLPSASVPRTPAAGRDAGVPATNAQRQTREPEAAETAPAETAETPVPAPAEPATQAEAPAPAAGALRLEFREESWVRIEDASGRSLLNGLQNAGSRVDLEGRPPFDTFFGNAPGVRMQYQGRGIDLAPHTRRNRTAALMVE